MDLIDPADPAFTLIATALQQARQDRQTLTMDDVHAAADLGRREFREHEARTEASRPGRIPASIVYYARRSDLVKIGTTTTPHRRFAALLPDEVLAWEPGGRRQEVARHRQFHHLRLTRRGEYFRRDDSLDTHIAAIAVQFGPPDPTWPTLAGLEVKPFTAAVLPGPALEPELATLKEATRSLGIRYNTAQVWQHRGKLKPFLVDDNGIQLYLLSDLKSLAEGRRKVA
ncbi:GIY-YIG nuclease family protein [Streptomyces sp. NPDC000351]|uniref:GIY-YIG nuclease family protein n=1 Tax=Streptomyces sp. NPDC000351 TaxID=3154250 RepID=UPI00332288D6